MSIDALIRRLRRERFEIDAPEHTSEDRSYRRGWNARTNGLIAELEQLRTEAGLVEIAEADDLTGLAAREADPRTLVPSRVNTSEPVERSPLHGGRLR